jgi:hypothetical protein
MLNLYSSFEYRLLSTANLCPSMSSQLPSGSDWNAHSLDYCSVREDRNVGRAASGQVGKNNNIRRLNYLSSKDAKWCRRSHLYGWKSAWCLQSENSWHWRARPPVLGEGRLLSIQRDGKGGEVVPDARCSGAVLFTRRPAELVRT